MSIADGKCWYCGTKHTEFTKCPEGTKEIRVTEDDGTVWRARQPWEGAGREDRMAPLGNGLGDYAFFCRVVS